MRTITLSVECSEEQSEELIEALKAVAAMIEADGLKTKIEETIKPNK